MPRNHDKEAELDRIAEELAKLGPGGNVIGCVRLLGSIARLLSRAAGVSRSAGANDGPSGLQCEVAADIVVQAQKDVMTVLFETHQ